METLTLFNERMNNIGVLIRAILAANTEVDRATLAMLAEQAVEDARELMLD